MGALGVLEVQEVQEMGKVGRELAVSEGRGQEAQEAQGRSPLAALPPFHHRRRRLVTRERALMQQRRWRAPDGGLRAHQVALVNPAPGSPTKAGKKFERASYRKDFH